MHPPFYVVDRTVAASQHTAHQRPHVRRTQPERLPLTAATAAWPPVPLVAPAAPPANVIWLQLAPCAKNTWRLRIGRWLIRAGQRMILQN